MTSVIPIHQATAFVSSIHVCHEIALPADLYQISKRECSYCGNENEAFRVPHDTLHSLH